MKRIVMWQTSAAERRWPFERLEQRLTYPLYLRASNTVCTHGECATPNTRAENPRAPVRPPTAPSGVACDRVGRDDWERVDMAATFGQRRRRSSRAPRRLQRNERGARSPILESGQTRFSRPRMTIAGERCRVQCAGRQWPVAGGSSRVRVLSRVVYCSGTGKSSRRSSRQRRRLRSTDAYTASPP